MHKNETLNFFDEGLFSTNIITEKSEEILNESKILRILGNSSLDMSGSFNLRNEAFLLQFAYSYNKILSLSNSRTRILAHQVESTHKIVNSLNQRFLLADEVGLGKTIEAGLVIKEMIYRYNYKRILVICPASLLIQWQHEMEEKFGEVFEIVDSKVLKKKRRDAEISSNPWDSFEKVICSLDFIKSEKCFDELKNSRWDAVIFDEAHRLRRDVQVSTLAYNIAELLSERTNSLLLLTATPFRGKLEELYYLIKLVDKNLLGPIRTFQTEFCSPESDLSPLREKLAQVLIRRTKKEIGGFTKRHAKTIRFDLYPEERLLYDHTTRYVAEEFNRAMQSENRAVGFVMVVFQKLLDSSPFALYSALVNRRASLAGIAEKQKNIVEANEEFDFSNIDEEELEKTDNLENLLSLSAEKTLKEVQEEIKTLDNLIELASSVKRNKKGEKLREMIISLKENGYKKFLVFTQFKTTQEYLKDLLSDFNVRLFHGSMDKMEKEKAIDDFKADAEILICTEAGGEGRNMQFCSVLFNYDLPWSPLKIEQRIGRIHRFGQKYDVSIYNFSTKDTVAEKVLEVLTKKLHLFEESIGMPDIMLGQIEDEISLNSLFMNMTYTSKSKNFTLELEESINRAKKSFEKLTDLAVTKKMDFNYDEYYRITQKERSFSNKQLEYFMVRFRDIFPGGKDIIGGKKKTSCYPVRYKEKLVMGTFDSDIALKDPSLEFLAFGHPLIDSIIKFCQSEDFGGYTGVKVIEYDYDSHGMIFTFAVTYKAKSETKTIIPIYVDCERKLSLIDIEIVEREFLFQHKDVIIPEGLMSQKISSTIDEYPSLYSRAREVLKKKIEEKIWELKENLDFHVDPEIEKIKESFRKELKELSEKLDLHEAQMKITGKDLRSVITRTKNQIKAKQSELDYLLAKNKRYLGVTYRIELVSAGVLVAIKR